MSREEAKKKKKNTKPGSDDIFRDAIWPHTYCDVLSHLITWCSATPPSLSDL